MPATCEKNVTLLHMQNRSAEAVGDAENESHEDTFSVVRGMVNGLVAGLMFWAVTLYLLMK